MVAVLKLAADRCHDGGGFELQPAPGKAKCSTRRLGRSSGRESWRRHLSRSRRYPPAASRAPHHRPSGVRLEEGEMQPHCALVLDIVRWFRPFLSKSQENSPLTEPEVRRLRPHPHQLSAAPPAAGWPCSPPTGRCRATMDKRQGRARPSTGGRRNGRRPAPRARKQFTFDARNFADGTLQDERSPPVRPAGTGSTSPPWRNSCGKRQEPRSHGHPGWEVASGFSTSTGLPASIAAIA